ncbi:MAG TPA: ABC transporter ATP-binding protein [Acidimicrobiales bacterium]|nr:ABC transporter ATP-binding protein [Acidimicrobiales bacterium]
MTNENVLEIESLSAGYGRYNVVHDISLHIAKGGAIALLGPNGAGKSTVLRAIMGLIKHREGHIRVDGTDLIKMAPHSIAKGHAALVPEGRRLFAGQSVEDNLRLGGMRFRGDQKKVDELLATFFALFPVIERYRSRPSTSLSGGEQQMVAIGRMMMNDPKLMLLDEPSLGLAPLAIKDMTDALVKLRQQGRSILLVEQRVDIALAVCDRIYVLSDGKIIDERVTASLGNDGRELIDHYLG